MLHAAHTQAYNKANKQHNRDIKRAAAGKYTKYTSDILDRQKTVDSAVRTRARNQSLVKSAAQQALLGGRGSVIYNAERAQGKSRLKSLKSSSGAALTAHGKRIAGLFAGVMIANTAYNSKSVSDFINKAFTVETTRSIYNPWLHRFATP